RPGKRPPKTREVAFHGLRPLLPSQYFGPQRPAVLQPERRLMLAVFEDAVHAYLRGMTCFPETRAWFEADDFEWPYSFANLCTALGLDRIAVRVALRRRRERRRLAA